MTRGRHTKRIAAIFYTMAFMAGWLSGCKSPFTPPATPYPTCTPYYSANIYNPTETPLAPTPFLPFPTFISPTPQHENLTAKQFAFRELVDHVERWTSVATVSVSDTSSVRVAITLLSRDLVWTVSTLDKMDENPLNPSNQMEATEHLKDIAASNSFLFFMSIFPIGSGGVDSTPHTVQIDAGELTLINASGLEIKPVSYDHNLDQRFASTDIAYGYLYFPFSLDAGKGCVNVLDDSFDTKLIFELSEIKIDDASTGPYSWMIQYTYLLNSENIHHNRGGWLPPPDQEIAAKDLPPSRAEINDDFWTEYAEFIWGKTTPAP